MYGMNSTGESTLPCGYPFSILNSEVSCFDPYVSNFVFIKSVQDCNYFSNQYLLQFVDDSMSME